MGRLRPAPNWISALGQAQQFLRQGPARQEGGGVVFDTNPNCRPRASRGSATSVNISSNPTAIGNLGGLAGSGVSTLAAWMSDDNGHGRLSTMMQA
jgi:hypothetical protein